MTEIFDAHQDPNTQFMQQQLVQGRSFHSASAGGHLGKACIPVKGKHKLKWKEIQSGNVDNDSTCYRENCAS